MSLGRERVLAALRAALEPLPFVRAFWEGGSAAFGRLDAYSDLDLHVDVPDDRVEDAFAAVDAALAALSPIELRWRLADPTWHGHSQCFYRLKDAGPYLLVDFVVMKSSSQSRFAERQRHGEPRVIFDKAGIVRATDVDRGALAERLAARRAEIETRMRLFAPFVEKELLRGNHLAALEFYRGLVLAPLHELVRSLYAPASHDFGLRYARRDLPPAVVRMLEDLAFVGRPEDLRPRVATALLWLDEALAAAREGDSMG